jgi:hypothetical protein
MTRERQDEKERVFNEALRINAIALRLVGEARSIGAPLARFGCLSPHDRVIEKERP